MLIKACLNVFISRHLLLRTGVCHQHFQNKAKLKLRVGGRLIGVKRIGETSSGPPKGGRGPLNRGFIYSTDNSFGTLITAWLLYRGVAV